MSETNLDMSMTQKVCECGCGQVVEKRFARGHHLRVNKLIHKPKSLEIRFWRKVEKTDGCWLWRGTIASGKYGKIGWNRKIYYAHRIAWMLANKQEIPADMVVMHSCDNPQCVNPAHLSLGSSMDNVLDAMVKGRQKPGFTTNQPLGERNRTAKATETQVKEIRLLADQGQPTKEIASKYGFSYGLVYKIAKRESWKYLEE